ncbi:MAG: helix-turn-helix domain-containing protein [Candidatus Micrarchaeia archaeon]
MQVQRKSGLFEPKVLEAHPKRLLIFRLALNMNQRELAGKLRVSQGTIWAMENGRRKQINTNTVLKVLNLMPVNGIVIPDYQTLFKRYSNIAEKGKFRGEYARRMANRAVSAGSGIKSAILKKPTTQEATLLKELNKQRIAFQFHGVIEASRKFVVDFVFPSDKYPKVVLEMKDLKLDYRKRTQAIDLAYRALKMRQSHPHLKLVAVVDGMLQNDALEILKDEYDKVLQNPSSREVVKAVKDLIGSTV